jgi:hypothetical protein
MYIFNKTFENAANVMNESPLCMMIAMLVPNGYTCKHSPSVGMQTHPGALDEIALFSHISWIGLLILIPLMLIMEGGKVVTALLLDGWASVNLVFLIILNGCVYTTYNLVSFLVLSRTDLITHAVLNVFRRVFIIVFTSIYFGTYLHILNLFGVFLAVAGVLLFSWAKRKNDKRLISVNPDPEK